MRTYINAIEHEILIQNKTNKLSVIRLEGFNSPLIYREVCVYLKSMLHDTEFIAKMSNEKYKEFCGENREEWKQSLEFIKINSYVDFDGAMTAWRNNTADIKDKVSNKKIIVLLMGTELVPDKGGLADFYCINPEIILKRLTKDYSVWFKELFNDKGFDSDDLKAIHMLFRVIFNNINVDLIRYSNLIDDLENKIIYSVDELIQEICFRLSDDWDIPSIMNVKKVPKAKSLLSGKLTSGDIITKAYNFINRTQYKNGITHSKLSAIEKKISRYAEDKDINNNQSFLTEGYTFNSYSEFSCMLVDFITGKNYLTLRDKFLKVDFGLIDDILNLKVDSVSKPQHEKINKITGEPLEVYIEMITKLCLEYRNNYNEMPNKILIRVNEIKLSNCSTEEEKDNLYKTICVFLGGLVTFLNESSYLNNENMKISYEDVFDPFNEINKDNIAITKTSNMNELCKVSFTIIARSVSDDKARKQEFLYLFDSKASWIQAFSLLAVGRIVDSEDEYYRIPLYGQCNQINEYVCCESDEEFFIKLEKIKLSYEYEEYYSSLIQSFTSTDIRNLLGLLFGEYKEFIVRLLNEGFFKTLTNNGGCIRVFNKYLELIEIIKNNYINLTSTQKEKLYLFLNIFIISGANLKEFLNNDLNDVIIPPYHPVMLEKIYYQMIFLRNGLDELISLINQKIVLTNIEIEKRLGYFAKMSIVTSAFDVFGFGKNRYIPTVKMHSYYGIYNYGECNYNIISEKVFDNELLDDQELDKKELIKKTHKSDILFKNIDDYLKTFPSASDGINIIFINPDDMQHVVAGIHETIKSLKDKEVKGKINLRIIVSDKRKNGADYLKYWLDAFFEDEKDIKMSTYLNYIDLTSSKATENIEKYIENKDIVFIYGVLEEKNVEFQKTSSEKQLSDYKFPALFTPLPVSVNQTSRGIDISQRQFSCANSHLQLLHKYSMPYSTDGQYKVIKELSINDINEGLLELIHKKCKWVVCIDEAIDKVILNDNNRKIIGFSTGQGTFGELNVTVSTRVDVLDDIKLKLKKRLVSKFNKWNTKRVEDAANFCLDLTKGLDGSRVLKALNPSDHEIHNYLAYVLTIQNLHLNMNNDKYAIRTLVNLDNHRHWFDTNLRDNEQESNSRPDFLLLEVVNSEKNLMEGTKLKINATVIECKMGYENNAHIEKAIRQILHGIKVLANNFDPNTIRVNKRYWFNQLYRSLVFSEINLEDNKPEYNILVNKISNIYSGNFEIEWNGKIFAYWLNQDNSNYNITDIDYDKDDFEFSINSVKLHTAGQVFIQKLLVPDNERNEDFEFSEIVNDEIREAFIDEIINDQSDVELDSEDRHIDELVEKPIIGINAKNGQDNKAESSSALEDGRSYEEAGYEEKSGISNDNNDEKYDVIINGTQSNEVKKKSLNDVRFLLGKDIKTNEQIFWEFGHPKLNNRHLLINGNSGSGKTYCIQTLIMEAIKNSISVIVFDYTDGFTQSKLDRNLKNFLGEKLNERSVKYEKFPINPFKKHKVVHAGKEFDEFDADIANRIASSFKAVYSLGDQQRNVVYEAVAEGLKTYGANMSFQYMAQLVSESKNSSASTLYSKIKPFIDYDPFLSGDEFSWKDILDSKGQLYIIQLSGYEREIQVMLTEIILWDIWSYATRYGNEDNPMPLVLDEAHNLSHDSSSPSGRILAEGRKFGISGWYATQFMKGRMDSQSIGNLQQAAQKLYFSPPEESIVEVSKYIDITTDGSKEWAEKLKKLTKGNCVTSGFKSKADKFDKYEPKIVNIISLEDRLHDK